MSQFEFAGAFVEIRAQLAKGFRATLREQIRKSVGDGITVPLKPQIAPFRAALQKEARKSPILVPVRPEISITKFREELRTKVRQAAKGVTIGIPVDLTERATRGGGGGTGGTRGGTSRQIDDNERLARAQDRVTQSTTLLTRARDQSIAASERLTRIDTVLRSTESGISSLTLQETQARRMKNLTLANELVQKRLLLESTEKEALTLRDTTRGQEKVVQLTERVSKARANATAVLNTEISSIRSREVLQNLNNDLLASEAELRRLNARATNIGATALANETKQLRGQVLAREADIVAQRKQLIEQQKATTRQRTGIRGAAAAGLGFLGLRGATLAASAPFLIGAAAATAAVQAVRGAAQLQAELAVLRVTSRATAQEMENVRNEAVALGRDIRLPGVTAADAAASMNQLVRAGLSVEDAIDGTRGVLQLATAAQIDFATASNLVASALNAFSLAGAEATHIADLFTVAANESQASIDEMGIALRQSAGAAVAVGVGVEDTVALLTQLARAGLVGSDAGTSLRTALIRLVNPTAKARDIIEQLGLRIRDTQGRVRPEVFGEFERVTNNLSVAQRDMARAIIFGQDAFRASSLIGREGVEGLDQTREAFDRAGAAAEIAGARAEGLQGQLSALSSGVETFATTIGSAASGPVAKFVASLNSIVGVANLAAGGVIDIVDALKDLNRELEDAIPGFRRFNKDGQEIVDILFLGPGDIIRKGFIEPFAGATEELKGNAEETAREIEQVFAQIGQGPLSSTSINAAVVQLDAMADKLQKGDAEAQRLAQSVREIIREIIRTQQLPSLEVVGNVVFRREQIRTEALGAAGVALEAFRSTFPQFVEVGTELMSALGRGMQEGVTKLDLGGGGLGLDIQSALAELEGRTDDQLRILRQRRANVRRQRIRQQQLVATGQRPDLEDELSASIAAEQELDDQIQGILDDRKRDADQSKREAEKRSKDALDAQEKRDQTLLDFFENSRRRRRGENRIEDAADTEDLKDDITAAKKLRRILLSQREQIRNKIKTQELRVEALREYTERIEDLRREIDDLQRRRAEAARERAATRREEIRRGIELDIEFAQTTENIGLERRARQRLIANLIRERDELLKQKKLTIEQKNRLKEIRNEIAEQRKALKDITDERKKMFAEMSFAFLTTQAGFFANVASNILGAPAVAGAVGGGGARIVGPDVKIGKGKTPTSALVERARQTQAAQTGGFTAGQAGTVISLLGEMVRLLGDMQGRQRHPESRRSARRANAGMDHG